MAVRDGGANGEVTAWETNARSAQTSEWTSWTAPPRWLRVGGRFRVAGWAGHEGGKKAKLENGVGAAREGGCLSRKLEGRVAQDGGTVLHAKNFSTEVPDREISP